MEPIAIKCDSEGCNETAGWIARHGTCAVLFCGLHKNMLQDFLEESPSFNHSLCGQQDIANSDYIFEEFGMVVI